MAESGGSSSSPGPGHRDAGASSRDTDQVLRDAETLIRHGKWLILLLRIWPWIRLLLMAALLALMVFALYWRASPLLFGKTMTFSFSGIHAPHYTRAEFEAEYIRRFTARGFTIESFRIIRETDLKQFDGEVRVEGIPLGTSKYDVLRELRAVSDSMKEKPSDKVEQ